MDFLVQGDHEFAVYTIQKSGSVVDPGATLEAKGDPSLSSATAVEQFRKKYVFLGPDDYDMNFADIIAPANAKMTLDGTAVSATGTAIGSTGYSVYRIKLSGGAMGAHTLDSDLPVGLQVIGYGSFTSYQYPGGVNLARIAASPPIF